jgi:hypothetical protein
MGIFKHNTNQVRSPRNPLCDPYKCQIYPGPPQPIPILHQPLKNHIWRDFPELCLKFERGFCMRNLEKSWTPLPRPLLDYSGNPNFQPNYTSPCAIWCSITPHITVVQVYHFCTVIVSEVLSHHHMYTTSRTIQSKNIHKII